MLLCETELPPVEDLKVWTKDGQMLLEWRSPRSRAVSEYVVEWLSGDHIDWQRESRNINQTVIGGNFFQELTQMIIIKQDWIDKCIMSCIFCLKFVHDGPSCVLDVAENLISETCCAIAITQYHYIEIL